MIELGTSLREVSSRREGLCYTMLSKQLVPDYLCYLPWVYFKLREVVYGGGGCLGHSAKFRISKERGSCDSAGRVQMGCPCRSKYVQHFH